MSRRGRASPPRRGFFERQDFDRVLTHLPDHLRPVARFSYYTGWRKGEVLGLQWRAVDFAAGSVRLEPGATKNKEGREFPFALLPELDAVLRGQRAATSALERGSGRIVPWVFHRDGAPIRDYYGGWRAACGMAGVPGRVFHDLRRTAARNLVRCGVSEHAAMKLCGHKTRSIFDRYCVVAGTDLREAVQKLAAYHRAQKAEALR